MPLRKRLDDLLVSLTGLHAQALRDYIDDALAECREECAKIADAEALEYARSRVLCDRSGNTRGGTNDACGQLACERVAARIRGEDQ